MHKNISEGAPRKFLLELKLGHPIEKTPSLETNPLLHGMAVPTVNISGGFAAAPPPQKKKQNKKTIYLTKTIKNSSMFFAVFFGGIFSESSLTLEGGAQDIGEHIAFLNKRLLRTMKPASFMTGLIKKGLIEGNGWFLRPDHLAAFSGGGLHWGGRNLSF